MQKTVFSKWIAPSLRLVRHICGLALVLIVCSGAVWAMSNSQQQKKKKPEIDPGSTKSALVLLGGGILLLRDSFRKRSR